MVLQLFSAILLYAVAIGAAVALPRWRTGVGPIVELSLLTVLLALRGHGIIPASSLPGASGLFVVLAYVFVRTQTLLIKPAIVDPVPPRWGWMSFGQGAESRGVHLLPFAAYVLAYALFDHGKNLYAGADSGAVLMSLIAISVPRGAVAVTAAMLLVGLVGS